MSWCRAETEERSGRFVEGEQKVFNVAEFDRGGRTTRVDAPRPTGETRITYTYTTHGCGIEVTIDNNVASQTVVQFDYRGYAVRWTYFDQQGSKIGSENCERDSVGRIIIHTIYQRYNTLSEKWVSEYDSLGRLAYRYGLGKTRATIADATWYEFDSLGQVSQEDHNDHDGDRRNATSTFFLRDSLGNVIQRGTGMAGFMLPTWITRYEHTYDEHGNWTVKREFKVETREGKEVSVPGVVWYRAVEYY